MLCYLFLIDIVLMSEDAPFQSYHTLSILEMVCVHETHMGMDSKYGILARGKAVNTVKYINIF